MAKSSSPQRKGTSIAKGPIGVLGLAGIAYGVLALIFGLYTNGWTDLLFIAAGLLLLLAARAHWAAKSAATLVGLVLAAAAIIAVVRDDGVFGIFAANHRTEIVWGVAAIVLLLLGRLGRVGRRSTTPTGSGSTGSGGDSPLISSR